MVLFGSSYFLLVSITFGGGGILKLDKVLSHCLNLTSEKAELLTRCQVAQNVAKKQIKLIFGWERLIRLLESVLGCSSIRKTQNFVHQLLVVGRIKRSGPGIR